MLSVIWVWFILLSLSSSNTYLTDLKWFKTVQSYISYLYDLKAQIVSLHRLGARKRFRIFEWMNVHSYGSPYGWNVIIACSFRITLWVESPMYTKLVSFAFQRHPCLASVRMLMAPGPYPVLSFLFLPVTRCHTRYSFHLGQSVDFGKWVPFHLEVVADRILSHFYVCRLG